MENMRFAVAVFVCIVVAGARAAEMSRLDDGYAANYVRGPYQGTNWSGNNINKEGIYSETAEGCRQECAIYNHFHPGEPQCVAFIFRTTENDCWIKYAVSDPSECGQCVGVNYEEPIVDPTFYPAYGYNRSGGNFPNMPIKTKDPNYCAQKCFETVGCVAWAWVRHADGCWLKHTKKQMLIAPAIVTGDKY